MKHVLLFSLVLITTGSAGFAQQKYALSLEEAKNLALQKSPLFRLQAKRVEAQEGSYWAGMTPENPEIGVESEQIPPGLSYSRYGERRVYITQVIDFPSNYYFRHKMLNARIRGAQFRLEEAKRELIFQVKSSYYNVLLQKELVTLAKKNVALSEDFYNRAKRSHELGESDRLTMLKAKVNLGEARKRLNSVQKDLDAAVSKLRQVLGLRATDAPVIELTDTIPETPEEFSYEELRKRLSNHPALKAAQVARQEALSASRLAYGGFLPQISLIYYNQEIERTNYWGGGIGLSFPLWFFGQKGRVQEKEAQLAIAEYFVSAEDLRLQKDLDQAVANFEKAANEVRLYQTSLLGEAEEVFRIARSSYAVGEIGYLQFIDAQQTLIFTREGYLRSLANYQIEKAHLTKLVGMEL
ncbi:MAG: TolC family protein [Chlorobi bacterium]|nr:TolC family protein [Chlorobiota bacterium]